MGDVWSYVAAGSKPRVLLIHIQDRVDDAPHSSTHCRRSPQPDLRDHPLRRAGLTAVVATERICLAELALHLLEITIIELDPIPIRVFNRCHDRVVWHAIQVAVD